ncbi:MAG: response regulator, partial [Candidatus Magnetomorum sp.]|nr:response regulator [Candidatus Magnetomorum sp.]
YIDILKKSSTHLLSLINDILDLSEIESGKISLSNACFDLHHSLDAIAQLFSYQVEKKGLSFFHSRSDDLIQFVKGDVNRLRQILINLIGNAIKFTKQGQIQMTVHPTDTPATFQHLNSEIDPNAHWVQFSVHDTGIGISKNQLSLIFEKFTQAKQTIRKHYGGTGLGLSICKQLVHLMGGNIGVESVESEGSVFSFIIPFIPGQKDDATDDWQQDEKKSPEQHIPLNILLAEDVPVNTKVATRMLNQIGHSVTSVQNGIEAIDALKKETYDVILMDIEMPEMDGFEATRCIRKGDAGEIVRKIPIIAMTAHALESFKEKTRAYGMNAFITKPVQKKILARVLSSIKETTPSNHLVSESIETMKGSIFDPSILLEICGDDSGTVLSIYQQFLVDRDQYLNNFISAYESKDFASIKTEAHSIKSICSTMNASACREMAQKMEQAATNQKKSDVDLYYPLLIEQLERLRTAIEKEIERLTNKFNPNLGAMKHQTK